LSRTRDTFDDETVRNIKDPVFLDSMLLVRGELRPDIAILQSGNAREPKSWLGKIMAEVIADL
jgi:hypothetical protein